SNSVATTSAGCWRSWTWSPGPSGPRSTRPERDTMTNTHVYVGSARTSGTLGGIFRRAAGNGHWEQLTKGLPEAVNVQAITVHPTHPDVVYLGGNRGFYRSTDRGERWERLGFSDERAEVCSVLVHPSNPRTLDAGTSPVGVYRTDDDGPPCAWGCSGAPTAARPGRTCKSAASRRSPPAATSASRRRTRECSTPVSARRRAARTGRSIAVPTSARRGNASITASRRTAR